MTAFVAGERALRMFSAVTLKVDGLTSTITGVSPEKAYHFCRRDVCECRDNDLVPRLEPEREQGYEKGVSAVCTRYNMDSAEISAEIFAELSHGWPVYEGCAADDLAYACIHLIPDSHVLTLEVHHFYLLCHGCQYFTSVHPKGCLPAGRLASGWQSSVSPAGTAFLMSSTILMLPMDSDTRNPLPARMFM